MNLPADVRAGERLYGNDLEGAQLAKWFEDEKRGFFDLSTGLYGGDQTPENFATRSVNREHAKLLARSEFDMCLALGCAAGEDIKSLGLQIDRIIAIEPGREWWSDRIGDVPAEYREPTVEGKIDLPDASVDLVVALGTLHHIPNVEAVIAEVARVLEAGGEFLIREPIVSMGDFTRPRPGLTRHERGIPAGLMRQFIERAGLTLRHQQLCGFNPLTGLLRKVGMRQQDRSVIVRIDRWLSWAFAWNARYWRPHLIDKFAPSNAVYAGVKP